MSNINKLIEQRVAALFGRIGECPIEVPRVPFSYNLCFNIRGLKAGVCKVRRNPIDSSYIITIGFNAKALAVDDGRFALNEIVPHEVAHALASMVHLDLTRPRWVRIGCKGHGPGWKRIAQWLGATGKTTCSIGLQPSRNTRPYLYVASCGTEARLTKGQHQKVAAGLRFTVKKTGGKISKEGLISVAA